MSIYLQDCSLLVFLTFARAYTNRQWQEAVKPSVQTYPKRIQGHATHALKRRFERHWGAVNKPEHGASGPLIQQGPFRGLSDPKWQERRLVLATKAEPNIFLRICTHTQIITISIDLCPPIQPIAWNVPIHAHPCYSNCTHVFKNCVMCNTRLHQVLVGLDK
jgi:hypothetical protein